MINFQSLFVFAPIDHGIPHDDFSRVLVQFIDHFSQFFESEKKKNKRGRPSFDFWSMVKLILYGLYDGVIYMSKIAYYAEYNRIYQYVSDNITPDEKTIHNFIKDNSSFLEYLIELILITAFELEMSDFEHLCVDGTIKKANCN